MNEYTFIVKSDGVMYVAMCYEFPQIRFESTEAAEALELAMEEVEFCPEDELPTPLEFQEALTTIGL